MNDDDDGNKPVLRVRINQIDHVLEQSGPLDNSTLPKAPVIRVYGQSSLGKKCCLHIHQVYPYFFVEYKGDLNGRKVREYAAKLKRSLNHAIAISMKRPPDSTRQHFIRAVLLVKGIHFYGFHSSYSPFLKIYVVDPSLFSRTVTLLQSGSVMSTRFRVFESHLTYIPQFLADFGLYGCGWLDLDFALKRGVDEDEEMVLNTLPTSPHFRQSRMPLEVDAQAYHILNRHKLAARNYHHELKIPAPAMPNEPFVLSVRELWEDERKRRVARGLPPSPELPIDPSESSRGHGADWVAEARWWDAIRTRIERERHDMKMEGPPGAWTRYIMSAFESVEALWEDEFKVWKPETSSESEGERLLDNQDRPYKEGADEDVDIDMSMVFSQDMDNTVNNEERDWEQIQEQDDSDDEQIQEEDPYMDVEEDDLSVPLNGDGRAEEAGNGVDPFHDSGAAPSNGDLVYPEVFDMSSPDGLAASISPPPSPSHRDPAPLSAEHPSNKPIPNTLALPEDRPSQLTTKSTTFQSQPSVKVTPNRNGYVYRVPAPKTTELLNSLDFYDLPTKIYRAPHYSKAHDAPERPKEYGGYIFHLKGGHGIKNLLPWQNPFSGDIIDTSVGCCETTEISGWEYAGHAPSVKVIKAWLMSDEGKRDGRQENVKHGSQIEGPTQANIYNLKATPLASSRVRERNDMSVLALEVLAPSHDEKLPNPEEDEVVAVFYSLQESEDLPRREGIIVVDSGNFDPLRIRDFKMEVVRDEIELINTVVDTVLDMDPDVLVGWDVQLASWSYLAARADIHGMDVAELISRAMMSHKKGPIQWDIRKSSTFKVAGRQVLNVWRLMRSELNLNMYTFENVVFDVLRIRTPKYSSTTLSEWYFSELPSSLGVLFRYYAQRTSMVLDILNATDVVTKTAEFARVFGVDFFSVITRGSQFKVESFMFRIGKPESFVLLSPSKADVGKQNAAECMPLIMEPQSAFYTSPVVILDFQSLYPSIMIAYNYCYSTCLGRVAEFQGRNKFGVTDLDIPHGLIDTLKDYIQVAPNGIMYVKQEVRKGLLGRMLVEMLDTRVMIKQAMKGVKDDKTLLRILDARQRGLKYIANVIYGYTSATFSGRMPAVEIADSIVQSGRETLEKAIMLIDSTPKWGAKVVYGDTDSVFIHLHGKTKDQAFRIGQDIADTITALNPAPIKLKFEKVYLPCVLMAKKRYVGYKYEYPDETEPTFDAKGIETVRRDGVPAQQKMVETCLKLLFRTQDLSLVKSYCCRSWSKLLENKASVEDFIFAKEVRLGTYSENGPPPPGAVIAAKRMILDPHDEAQWGERIPYVIARGPEGARLVDRVLSPLELLDDPHTGLDAEYYISRVLIPPLERIFNLLGANVRQWYDEMPKIKPIEVPSSPSKKQKPEVVELANIDEHFTGARCLICGSYAPDGICRDCRLDNMSTLAGVLNKSRKIERRFAETQKICMSCALVPNADEIKCESLDCPWMFARRKAETNLDRMVVMEEFIHDLELDALEHEGELQDQNNL